MDLFTEHVAGPGKMDFQDLADVHSGRYAQWVQYQIDRTAIRGERHIFDRHDAGAYALVAVTACHLIAFTDLTFLRDVDTDELVHARCQLITVFTGEDFDIDDFAEFAVRHTQGGITDFSFFVTEDRTQQSFFRRQLRLALRGDLTDQDIARTDVSADHDDTVFIEVFDSIFRNRRQLTGDLFLAQLRVAGVAFIFFDMNGGVQVILAETFGDQNGVFMVVPFPGYESYEYIVAESQLAAIGRHAVCQCVSRFYAVALGYDRVLVDAGGLVGTHEFDDVVGVKLAIVCADNDLTASDSFDSAGMFRQDADTGVLTSDPFHAGADERCFRTQERYSLTLHVRTHQSSVRIIVFKEWNEGRTDGYDLLRGYVHQHDFVWFRFEYVRATAARYVLMNEVTFRIERFARLRDDLVFFNVCSHIFALVSDGVCLFVDQAVRCLDEAILIDDPVVGQGRNQTDVRTFRGFYRAHTSIMGVMYVADFEPRTFTGKTARSQSGKTTLMRELCQRVRLVHELGQLGAAEEFLDSSYDWADIDERLYTHLILVLGSHSLANHPFHTGETDTELVLQELTDAADATIAQMVDVITLAIALHHVQEIVNAGDDIADLQRAVIVFAVAGRADHLDRGAIILLGHDFDLIIGREYTAFFDPCDRFFIDGSVAFDDHFTRFHIDDRAFGLVTEETVLPSQLLIQFVTADLREIITARIKEEIMEQRRTTIFGSRFTRAELVIDLDQSGLFVRGAVFFQRLFDMDIMIEKLQDLFIGRVAQRTDEDSDRHLTVTIDTDGDGAGRIRFQFDPRTAVRDQLRGINLLVESISFTLVVYARGTNQLGYDDTLGAIDDECTRVRHDREIPHEQIVLFQLAGFLVFQTRLHVQWSGVVHILRLALFDIVLALAEIEIAKVQRPFLSAVLDRRNICENILQPFLAEPFIRLRLQIEQMGHLQYFLRSGIGVSLFLPYHDRSEHLAVRHSLPHPFIKKTWLSSSRKKEAGNRTNHRIPACLRKHYTTLLYILY